jgi:hypothetical protein
MRSSSRSRLTIYVLAILIALLASGCQVIDRFTNADEACVTPLYAFADTFDDPTLCGWAQFDSAGASAEISDSVMRIAVSNNGQLAWSNPGRDFSDAIINVAAIPSSGPQNNAYGIVCRYTDPQNFYVFVISADGYYAIGKYDNLSPEIQYLTGEAPYYYQISDAIRQGPSANQIEARCVGNELTLFANGELLTTVRDVTHTTGDVGVTAGSFELGTVIVEFDDFSVVTP